MFTPTLQDSLKNCVDFARKMGSAEIYSEHLLYTLLSENGSLITSLGVNKEEIKAMKDELFCFLEKKKSNEESNFCHERKFSKSCQKILEKAIFWGKVSGYLLIEGWHIILAMLSESKTLTYTILTQHHVSQKNILKFYILQDPFQSVSSGMRFARQANGRASESADDSIENCLVHLTDPKIVKNLDPVIGRQDEISRITQILCCRKKNNPLLIGEAGVGKTAIIEGLAREIAEQRVPDVLKSAKLYSLDLAALLSGTKYRGDLEKRFLALVNRFEKSKNSILAIDEVHLIVGAGASSGGNVDLANLLKPLMASGSMRIIGATTHHEYQAFIEKDKALIRRFQIVPIEEPSAADAVKILKGVQQRYEMHHNVKYSHMVIQSIVDLAAKKETGLIFPDKALDLLDELGSSIQMKRKGKAQRIISAKDLELVENNFFQRGKSMPLNMVNTAMSVLEKKLKSRIFGQDEAILELINLLRLSRSGLRAENKPIASILIAGSSGTGKTQFSLLVSKFLELPLLRLDMSEYSEPQTISRLIGAPPGYIGNDRGGLLTDTIFKKPQTLILVDELDKAHPDVLNLFLQIMDGGILTDANGRQISFAQTLLIMTSNLGAESLEKTSIGFQKKSNSFVSLEQIKNRLSPEFRNRLDRILVFSPLNEAVQIKILNLALNDLTIRLKERHGIKLKIGSAARQHLAQEWQLSDKTKDARGLLRWLESSAQLLISEELLSKKHEKGDTFFLEVASGNLVVLNKNEGLKKDPAGFSIPSSVRNKQEYSEQETVKWH